MRGGAGDQARRAVGSDRNHPVPEQCCSRAGALVGKGATRAGRVALRGSCHDFPAALCSPCGSSGDVEPDTAKLRNEVQPARAGARWGASRPPSLSLTLFLSLSLCIANVAALHCILQCTLHRRCIAVQPTPSMDFTVRGASGPFDPDDSMSRWTVRYPAPTTGTISPVSVLTFAGAGLAYVAGRSWPRESVIVSGSELPFVTSFRRSRFTVMVLTLSFRAISCWV